MGFRRRRAPRASVRQWRRRKSPIRSATGGPMSTSHLQPADVVIVGGGVMGCAAAYHLARDGRRVLLLERFAIGHDRGSSHGPSRIIRLAYDTADYVRLAEAS